MKNVGYYINNIINWNNNIIIKDREDERKEGTARLSHPHYLVYINVKNIDGMKNIEDFKFGHNIYYEKDDYFHDIEVNIINQ